MSSKVRAPAFARTLVLIVSSLAAVGVLFAIYLQYGQTAVEVRPEAKPVHRPPPVPNPSTVVEPSGSSTMEIQGIPIPRGGRTRINLYAPEGDRPRAELEWDAWEPLGAGREFRLTRPTIRFRTPEGQRVNVTADEGVVEMTRQRGDNYDLARGRLTGGVVVLVDRFDDARRDQLPPELREELTDDRKILVELEDLAFDMEYARIESSGYIHAALAEAEFEGRQLMLRYDEAASRITYLKIAQGKRIVLRNLGQALAITLPGAKEGALDERKEPEPAPQEEPTAPTENTEVVAEQPPLVDEDGVPLFVPNPPQERRVHQTVTYTATFEGDVAVDQFEDQTQTGVLTADSLAFLFDFGQQQRDLAGTYPGPQATTQESSEQEGAQPAADESEVVLHWTGPLVVDLLRDPGEVPEDIYGKRLHVTAAGREVNVADRQGRAQCRKLVYHNETEQVWLYGEGESGFTLDIETGGHVSGRQLSFDPRGQTATVQGPGFLAGERNGRRPGGVAWMRDGDDGEVFVSFEDEMKLCLGTVQHERIDEQTGEPQIRQQDYLQSAELFGDVMMAQDGDFIAADHVALSFLPPEPGSGQAAVIQTLHAEGEVRMVQGEERITCRRIDVSMTQAENGRLLPTRADALGDVVVSEGERTISATQRMIVDLEPVAVDKPAFDLVQAKIIASRRGLNVNEIDWDAQRERYESEKDVVIGLERVQAFGDVKADDPVQNLTIDAGWLDCRFRDGRRIHQGVVQGRGARPAEVAFGDFGIQGRRIEFDAAVPSAEVPGAGRVTFRSRKDLDGETLRDPIPIAVAWTGSMNFRGRENTAAFAGAVHAVSENSTFDCDELMLDFEDETSVAAAPPPEPDLWDWWILRPFRYRVERPRRLRLEGPEIRKELVYLSARGNVVGLTATYDPDTGALRTRARLSGPHLAADLHPQTQAMTIDDAGTLLIEDYRLPKPQASAGPARLSPFGAEAGDLPSQTLISWAGAMSYYSDSRLAVFEDDVQLVHRSGSNLILADGLFSDAALSELRASSGGRDAQLTCEALNVQFLNQKAAGRTSAPGGLEAVSGNQVAGFSASGGAYFEDSGVSVACRTITFDRQRNLLQILGTRERPAELIDQRRGQYRSITGPTIYWERDTDRIEAPQSSIRVH